MRRGRGLAAVALIAAAAGGCGAAPSGTAGPSVSPSSGATGSSPSPTPISPTPSSSHLYAGPTLSVPWTPVDGVTPGSGVITARFDVGGCTQFARMTDVETAHTVTVGVDVIDTERPGQVCPLFRRILVKTVHLHRALGSRRFVHARTGRVTGAADNVTS